MKTMSQMQNEIISKAKWNGGFPKVVHMGLGVLALANNQAEYYLLVKQGNYAHLVAGVIAFVSIAALIAYSFLL